MSIRSPRSCSARYAALAVLVAGAVGAAHSRATEEHYGAAMNYRLHCEGCHQADGAGQPGYIPDLRDNIARFLATAEGRAYLARVPGTAQSLLTDVERAEVLNWMLATFDPAHLPKDFVPYSGPELAQWRHDALSQPGAVRTRLLAAANTSSSTSPAAPAATTPATSASATAAVAATKAPLAPPAAFAICAACHPVSPDGVAGMGPNLHGIVGRPAGTAAGFIYSPAMRSAGITWDAAQLDGFIAAPAQKIPGNYMSFAGLPGADDRKAVIEYLNSLR